MLELFDTDLQQTDQIITQVSIKLNYEKRRIVIIGNILEQAENCRRVVYYIYINV